VAYGGAYGENYWYQESEVWNHPILTQYVPRRILDARARRPVTAPDNEWNHIVHRPRGHGACRPRASTSQIGAHGQREGLAAHWELWSLAQGGMAPMDIIRAGTLNGARPWAGPRHRLAGGRQAGRHGGDERQPAGQHPQHDVDIAYTVANGRVYDSHMDEVGRRNRPRQPFWFASADGEASPAGVAVTSAADHGDGDTGD
jgi:hypothetical protein